MISLLTYIARWALFAAGAVYSIYCTVRHLRSKHDMPVALITFDVVCALPAAAAPVVLFGSIFLLDNPDSVGRTFLCIALFNSYAPLLVAGAYLSFKTYVRTRRAFLSALPAAAGFVAATAAVWGAVALLGW